MIPYIGHVFRPQECRTRRAVTTLYNAPGKSYKVRYEIVYGLRLRCYK
ncbi:hypothetical protein ANAPRD1_00027 [Anaplasma phagocytophilum]|nr:hypothetical protein ANAPRD1_00027 [Anaplasma phagocytophilum]SCV64642.1 hypothetical protein ANAPH1_00644 [Anaplasma phagocytophilum]